MQSHRRQSPLENLGAEKHIGGTICTCGCQSIVGRQFPKNPRKRGCGRSTICADAISDCSEIPARPFVIRHSASCWQAALRPRHHPSVLSVPRWPPPLRSPITSHKINSTLGLTFSPLSGNSTSAKVQLYFSNDARPERCQQPYRVEGLSNRQHGCR